MAYTLVKFGFRQVWGLFVHVYFCLIVFFCVMCLWLWKTLCEQNKKSQNNLPRKSSIFTIQVCPIFIFAFSCNVWEPTLLLKYRFSTQLFEVELVHLAISKGLWIANLMKNSIYRRSISCRLYHFLLGQYLCFSQ